MLRFEQENNTEKGRFIIFENGEFAGEITYSWAGETKFIIDHTEVDPKFGGKGLGKQLVVKVAAFAKDNNLSIIPYCPYARKVFERNANLQEVLFK